MTFLLLAAAFCVGFFLGVLWQASRFWQPNSRSGHYERRLDRL